jgi:altronate dehydratase small subunit
MEMKLALKVNDRDNVATIFASGLTANTEVELRDKKGRSEQITLVSDIPYGHKIAVRDIQKGETVMKYGEVIGVASSDILKGDHVHIRNMDSTRGRGDLQ